MSLTRTESSPFDLLRPFVWLAAFAFFVGFATYMVVGAGGAAKAYSRTHTASPIESSLIDWNSRKAI